MAKPIIRKIKNCVRMFVPGPLRDARERASLCRSLGLIHFAPWRKYRVINSKFGKRCRLGGSCIIRDTTFGDFSYAETGVRITQATIGNFTSIGPGVTIGLAGHPLDKYASTHPAFYLHQPQLGYDLVESDLRSDYQGTIIGSDVWIGANALVKDGITIGDGAIIGAGAMVTKNVEPYTIVAGVPAKPLRKRFDDETIDALLALRWWARGEAWIREHREEMVDVSKLIQLSDDNAAKATAKESQRTDGEPHGVS